MNTKPPTFHDPYGDTNVNDKSLVQCNISTSDYVFLKSLGEKRGLIQTTIALCLHTIITKSRKARLSDYTHQNEYERIVNETLGLDRRDTTAAATGQLQPPGGGTVAESNGKTSHCHESRGAEASNPVLENITSLGTNAPLGVDGRTGLPHNKKTRNRKKNPTHVSTPTTKS